MHGCLERSHAVIARPPELTMQSLASVWKPEVSGSPDFSYNLSHLVCVIGLLEVMSYHFEQWLSRSLHLSLSIGKQSGRISKPSFCSVSSITCSTPCRDIADSVIRVVPDQEGRRSGSSALPVAIGRADCPLHSGADWHAVLTEGPPTQRLVSPEGQPELGIIFWGVASQMLLIYCAHMMVTYSIWWVTVDFISMWLMVIIKVWGRHCTFKEWLLNVLAYEFYLAYLDLWVSLIGCSIVKALLQSVCMPILCP